MARVRFEGSEVECRDGETVLDTLLRHRLNVTSSCRAGTCQSCMLRCVAGTPGPGSQEGLKETLRLQGYFLPCRCRPAEDLSISRGEVAQMFVSGRIAARARLADRIDQFFVETSSPIEYRAGQFVHLRRPDGLVRSYSLASDPARSSQLELHVTRLDRGQMSSWLHDQCEIGTELSLRGPSGDCFYVPGRPEQPLLLVGTGSGLAPLLGIIRAALSAGHAGGMHLYHGSYEARGLYLVDELRELAAEHDNVHYHPCVDRGEDAQLRRGRAHEVALGDQRDLTGWRVFLCGHPGMVQSTRKLAYLAGADLGDILADAFVTRPSPPTP